MAIYHILDQSLPLKKFSIVMTYQDECAWFREIFITRHWEEEDLLDDWLWMLSGALECLMGTMRHFPPFLVMAIWWFGGNNMFGMHLWNVVHNGCWMLVWKIVGVNDCNINKFKRQNGQIIFWREFVIGTMRKVHLEEEIDQSPS